MNNKIRVFFVKFIENLNNLILEVVRIILFLKKNNKNKKIIKNIAIYRIGNIGDIICSLPSINLIKQNFPDSNITLVTSKGGSKNSGAIDFLNDHKSISNIIDYDPNKIKSFYELIKLINLLKSKKFDLWIDLPVQYERLIKIILRIVFVKICKVKSGFGWNIGNKPYFPLAQIKTYKFQNEVHRLISILKKNLNLRHINNQIVFNLPINNEIKNNTIKLVNKYNNQNLPIVIIAPGSKRSANLWKKENFIKVSKHIIDKGYFIFIIGGKMEEEYAKTIQDQVNKNIISLSGKLSILESASLIENSKVCICVDSGAQHLSSAVGTRAISLFSGRDFPGMWYPEGYNNTVIRKVDICKCFLKDFCVGNKCMNLISVNQINNIFDKLNV